MKLTKNNIFSITWYFATRECCEHLTVWLKDNTNRVYKVDSNNTFWLDSQAPKAVRDFVISHYDNREYLQTVHGRTYAITFM